MISSILKNFENIQLILFYIKRVEEDLGAKQLAAMAAAEKLGTSKSAKAEPSPFARIGKSNF